MLEKDLLESNACDGKLNCTEYIHRQLDERRKDMRTALRGDDWGISLFRLVDTKNVCVIASETVISLAGKRLPSTGRSVKFGIRNKLRGRWGMSTLLLKQGHPLLVSIRPVWSFVRSSHGVPVDASKRNVQLLREFGVEEKLIKSNRQSDHFC